jgi:parvulin-like peptidyl-prolyl isomerase
MLMRRLFVTAGVVVLAGCSSPTPALPETRAPAPTAVQTASFTAATATRAAPLPTSTLRPTAGPTAAPTRALYAARVNGQEISRARFDVELARYLAADPSRPDPNSAAGKQLAAQLSSVALDAVIEQTLLEQEAKRLGVSIADRDVDEEIRTLAQLRGGRDAYLAWLKLSRMSEDDARELVRADLIMTALRDRIVGQLPRTAEYVHAWHIVLASRTEADRILAQAQRGGNFSALATNNSIDMSTRPAGGDLGWFARGTGSVIWQEVEDAAFALNLNALSGVVASPIGFHIIKVTERQTRALTVEDQSRLQQAAMEQWLVKLKAGASIERAN